MVEGRSGPILCMQRSKRSAFLSGYAQIFYNNSSIMTQAKAMIAAASIASNGLMT